MYTLRPIQVEPVEKGIDFFNNKSISFALEVCPTAFGKSLVIASIANKLSEKTLVLQPNRELLLQNSDKLKSLGGEYSYYSASMKEKSFHNLTYGTLQSLYKNGDDFFKMGYKNLIIDEADSYPREVKSMLHKFMVTSKINKCLGFTATPFKLVSFRDRKKITHSKLKMLTSYQREGLNYSTIIHLTQISEMVENNYWCKLKYEVHDPPSGLLLYNSNNSDYLEESVLVFYKNSNLQEKIVKRVESSDRKKILIFVPSVEHALSLESLIPDSVAIYGDMPISKRVFAINGYKSNVYRVAITVDVLSIGFDCPQIDMIIGGRPTMSLRWLYQAYGRGTRISDSKKDCLIVDFAGNFERFGRIEDLVFIKSNKSYELYGSGGKQLTSKELSTVHKLSRFTSSVVFPYGKYVGQPITNAPLSYINWWVKDIGEDVPIVYNEMIRIKKLLLNEEEGS